MEALKALIRYFSYLFHGLLALFLLAISSLTLLSGGNNLHLGMLPWTGATLTYIVFFGSLFGLLTLLLALKKTQRWLFFLWSLAVMVLLIKGYILSGYHLSLGEARIAAYLMLSSILAMFGAFLAMIRPRMNRKGMY